MVRAEPGAAVAPLLATPADERNGMVSPDGRWLAYESDRSGRFEVWVGPFPHAADRWWQVSTDGGRHPAWSHDGHELFFVTLDGLLMAVPVDPREAVWNAGTPQRLFDRRYYTGGGIPRQYDVSPDGQRFLMLAQGTGDRATAPLQVIVVQNWLEELRRLVPPR
jgi:serine/threonine-protein kinase